MLGQGWPGICVENYPARYTMSSNIRRADS